MLLNILILVNSINLISNFKIQTVRLEKDIDTVSRSQLSSKEEIQAGIRIVSKDLLQKEVVMRKSNIDSKGIKDYKPTQANQILPNNQENKAIMGR